MNLTGLFFCVFSQYMGMIFVSIDSFIIFRFILLQTKNVYDNINPSNNIYEHCSDMQTLYKEEMK